MRPSQLPSLLSKYIVSSREKIIIHKTAERLLRFLDLFVFSSAVFPLMHSDFLMYTHMHTHTRKHNLYIESVYEYLCMYPLYKASQC